MLRAFVFLTGLLAAGPGLAADAVDLEYENFYIDSDMGRARIILKVTNNTGQPLSMVIAECAFLNKEEKAVDTATLIGSNIPTASAAYLDGWSSQTTGIEKVTCRISNSR